MNVPTALETKDRPVPPDHRLPAAPSVAAPEPTEPAKRRNFWWVVWLLILAALGYGGWRWYQGKQAQKQAQANQQAARMANRPVPVVATPARRGDMPVYLRGLGTVTASNTVVVKTRVDGQLTQIAFREGQFVHQGDLLAQIDPRPFQVQLEQAQGQLSRDQAQLKDAQVNLDRYRALWDEQVIARQQLDTQAAAVGQVKGTIEADQANIDNAKLQLTYARVTAPLSGVIGLRAVDVGNIVKAADTNGIATITQLQPISVIFTIPADNLQPVLRKLRSGARLSVDAYDRDDRNKIASGVLLTVDNQIDPTTGTSRLKATFNNEDHALFPNQFVNCRLLLDTKRNATLIPVAALQRGPQGTFVYVVGGNKKAAVRPVTSGLTEDNDAEITAGLQPGEIVVTDGQDKLQDGTTVDMRTRAPGSGARAGGGNRTPAPGGMRGQQTENYAPGQKPPATPPATGQAGSSQGMPQGQTPGPATSLRSGQYDRANRNRDNAASSERRPRQ